MKQFKLLWKNAYLALLFSCLFGLVTDIKSQIDCTDSIANPSFETGNDSGWTWSGTGGYAWIGVNTDGDGTKTGSYIAGTWNSTIGDVELSQVITGLNDGMYTITADLMGSSNATTSRLTTQRLFANGFSMLFGAEGAYSTENMNVIGKSETFSFGGYTETQSDAGPFLTLTVSAPVTNGSLTLGIRTNGKSSSMGYQFPNLTLGNGHGWFKVDNFRLTYTGVLTEDVKTSVKVLDIKLTDGTLSPAFDTTTLTYSVTLPIGVDSVKPEVVPEIYGVYISGDEFINVSSGSGTSVILVTSVDSSASKTYTINYTIEASFDTTGTQQDKLYKNQFPLGDVTLLEGPFKHAQDLNIEKLLEYDVDRLLAPYLKEAGLTPKAESYPNWDGLDGHIGGHYLSAMAIHYAATGNATCKLRMDYMITELKACQDANGAAYPDWGIGYVGGVPSSSNIWPTFKTGDFTNFNSAWVPWYNLHKMYAGLRDAWLYGENDLAKTMFILFCDWGIEITSGLSDSQMENMLDTEYGGMNETYADAYQITSDPKYLVAAKRFSHKDILNSMASHTDNLDNMHANTQIPKAVGFQRIAELSDESNYVEAAHFFWHTVTENRSLAHGGNSIKEYFPKASACMKYIHDVEGPESCNTYNMLKLAEDLFRTDPDAKYADYYERALYNHILSTQHPEHGGYVYFTPARPQHYRVYSAPNQAMWCCVGSGMENHGKYGEFIYALENDSLYLNLFIASELSWAEKNITILQETTFPEEEQTRLSITTAAPTDFTLMVRSPKWVSPGMLKIIVNGDTLEVESVPQTYIPVQRTWNNGDSVRILLPMHNTVEELPNVSEYLAIMHGPILLGAKTDTNDLAGLIADDSRWGHIANGSLMPLDKAPIIVGDRDSISLKIEAVEDSSLVFSTSKLFTGTAHTSLVLEPFYKIHDTRYMMYWMALTKDEYQQVLDSLAEIEKAKLELQARTIDEVAPGEQQPEADHNFQSLNSFSGSWKNEFWRDARNGGFISYDFQTFEKSDLSLMVRYWGNESGSRTFDILIDEDKLTTENIVGKWNVEEFVNVEYPIPNSMTDGKEGITVKFQGINSSNMAGGLFYVRLLTPLDTTTTDTTTTDTTSFLINTQNEPVWSAYTKNGNIVVIGLPQNAIVSVYDLYGKVLYYQQELTKNHINIPCTQNGIKIVRVINEGKIDSRKVVVR